MTTLKAALRGCRVTPLGFMNYIAVAAPELAREKLASNPLGKHNFRAVPFIAFNRKDDMQGEFVSKAFGLKGATLDKVFVPSSEGQVRALRAGWGAAVLPQLLVQADIEAGRLVNICPSYTLPMALYWHCWNLQSDVLDALSKALHASALQDLSGGETLAKAPKP